MKTCCAFFHEADYVVGILERVGALAESFEISRRDFAVFGKFEHCFLDVFSRIIKLRDFSDALFFEGFLLFHELEREAEFK